MTILIAGTVEVAAHDRDKALAEAAALMSETRAQPGCIHYVWSADPTHPKRIYVFENWAGTEDLAAHLAGPFYARMLALLGRYGAENAQVSKFRVDLEEPVYDDQGTPRADFFTS